MSNINIGIIGIGNIGSAHANCIANGEINGLKLCAVCDIDDGKLASFTQKYDFVKSYADYNEFFKDEMLDAVIIAVPHPLHSEIAVKALKNDLHVLLEKPIDISVSNAQKLKNAAANSTKVFSMMLNQRTNALFKKAREIVKGGELGELKRASWTITNWYRTEHYYNSSGWRATWRGEGGGVLLNQAPHNLDILQWICGMPNSVTGYCNFGKYHNIEVEDEATLYLTYDNGATATFITSTGEYPGTNRLEIIGDLGKIVLENGLLKWWKLDESERSICVNSQNSVPSINTEILEFKTDVIEWGHKQILQNFANSILLGEELIAPGEEGINELMISNAAYLSEWSGNKRIDLPFDNKKFDKLLNKRIKKSVLIGNDNNDKLSKSYKDRWQVKW